MKNIMNSVSKKPQIFVRGLLNKTRNSSIADKQHDAFPGQSRSPNDSIC